MEFFANITPSSLNFSSILDIHWLSSSLIQINLRCGSTNELFQVSEPSRCEYLMEFKTPAACRNVGDSVLSHEHGGELWSNITLKSVQNFYCKQNQIVNVINFFDTLMMMMIMMLNVWVLQSKIINLGRRARWLAKVEHSWCRIKILGTNSMRNFFFMLTACDMH